MASLAFLVAIALTVIHVHYHVGEQRTFTLVNHCEYTVWPAMLSNAGVAPLSTTGFSLQQGETKVVTTPPNWAGRFWGRTHCSTNASTGFFTCLTGDCGSGMVECSGAGAKPPATLVEFTLAGDNNMDFYDVSLVDGYNLPILVAPRGGGGEKCVDTGCVVELNGPCPQELRVIGGLSGAVIACTSACEAFDHNPQFCCSGAYGTPDKCQPSRYSLFFKNACPRAYSYAYDDKTSTFTCTGSPDYTITFCPSSDPKHGSNGIHKSWAYRVANSRKGILIIVVSFLCLFILFVFFVYFCIRKKLC